VLVLIRDRHSDRQWEESAGIYASHRQHCPESRGFPVKYRFITKFASTKNCTKNWLIKPNSAIDPGPIKSLVSLGGAAGEPTMSLPASTTVSHPYVLLPLGTSKVELSIVTEFPTPPNVPS
jgi:hypothetical protein